MTAADIADRTEIAPVERARFESACASWGLAAADFEIELVRRDMPQRDDDVTSWVHVVRRSTGARDRYAAGPHSDWPLSFYRALEGGRFG